MHQNSSTSPELSAKENEQSPGMDSAHPLHQEDLSLMDTFILFSVLQEMADELRKVKQRKKRLHSS